MFLAVTLVVGATSCEKEESGAPEPGDGGVLLLELRPPVDETNIDHLRDGVLIFAETTTEYSCIGYTIRTEHHAENGVNIDFGGIVAPSGPCATAMAPAIASVQFDNLAEEEHAVTITYKGETISGTLAVTETEYRLTLESNEVVRVVDGELTRRYPDE